MKSSTHIMLTSTHSNLRRKVSYLPQQPARQEPTQGEPGWRTGGPLRTAKTAQATDQILRRLPRVDSLVMCIESLRSRM